MREDEQGKDNATQPMDAGRKDEKMLGIKKSIRIFSPLKIY